VEEEEQEKAIRAVRAVVVVKGAEHVSSSQGGG
jgi:hypothetical protein